MKTYACRVTDYVGASYTVGYFLSSSPAEALERARQDWGKNASAVEVEDRDRMILTIDSLIDAENSYMSSRIREGVA